MEFMNGWPVSSEGGDVRVDRRFPSGGSAPEPPPAGESVTQEMIDFAAAWQALTEPTHENTSWDAGMQLEMQTCTNVIARRDACTHVAVQNGDWATASTWLNVSTEEFEVPGAGDRPGIPIGIAVTYDSNADTAYDDIRIDGTLTFARDQNTKLVADTIVCCCTSTWDQGTVADPIPAAYTSIVEFTTGNLDPTTDTVMIGRGLITMGNCFIHGAVKDHWGTVSTSLSDGATSLTLDTAPTGWAIGDEIHVMATLPRGYTKSSTWIPNESDNVTITDIDGATITFTPALTYDHTIPTEADFPTMKIYVVNFTRNVKFRSPADTPVHQRGHIMQMKAGTDCRWAEASWLGRTRKDVPAFDATSDAQRLQVMGSNIPWAASGEQANVKGRYTWHLHRPGVQLGAAYSTWEGLTATQSEGWHYSHHEGNAFVRKCAARKFVGAAYMAEGGSESGEWTENFAGERMEGEDANTISGEAEKRYSAGTYTDGVYGTRYFGPNDFGRYGTGMWFKARNIFVEGNVIAGMDSGMVWMARGGVANQLHPSAENLPESRIGYGFETVTAGTETDRPILVVKNNTAVGLRQPFVVIKSSPNQGHEQRSEFFNNLCWNISGGSFFEYTGQYTVQENYFLKHRAETYLSQSIGMRMGQASSRFVVWGNVFRGYTSAAIEWRIAPAEFPTRDHRHITGENTIDAGKTVNSFFGETSLEPGWLTYFDNSDIVDQDPTFVLDAEPVYPNTPGGVNRGYTFKGDITDELWTGPRGSESYDLNEANGARTRINDTQLDLMLTKYGYYTYSGNSYLLIPDLISRVFVDNVTERIPVRYLTLALRVSGSGASIPFPLSNYVNRGALPQRYVDSILIGEGTPPGSPDPNAGAWVVYEDILG